MRSHRVLIPLAALAAVLPMLLHGPSCGHDFDFHLLNWLEANTQLSRLQYPHWAYTPAWNAGEPRFVFYPPLSWLLGALLTVFFPFPYVPIAFTFVTLTAAGFALHHLASPYASPAASTVAAVLYLLNPYMLFTAYERTAYAELLAAAFIPLLFAAILTPRPRMQSIAIPLALLWLTNAPAAVMSSYALALLTLVRLLLPFPSSLFLRRTLSVARTTVCGTILGLALAAFYILPAAYERRFVAIAMVTIAGMAPADNTLFHHMALVPGVSLDDAQAHDQVLHTASLLAILLLLATALAIITAVVRIRRRPLPSLIPDPSFLVLPSAILTLTIAVLLTSVSLPVWHHLPQLAFLQFPWRLLALLTPILAVTTAVALSPLLPDSSSLTLPLIFALAAVLIAPAWPTFRQSCDTPDTPQARAALYRSPAGAEPTDEYTPMDADPDALHPEDPPYWLIPPSSPIDTPAPSGAPGQAPNHLRLTLPTPEILILNRRRYPLWQITLNSHQVDSVSQRNDGLIAIPLPAGTSTIDLTLRHTRDQLLGLALSVLALVILLLLHLRGIQHPLHSSNTASSES